MASPARVTPAERVRAAMRRERIPRAGAATPHEGAAEAASQRADGVPVSWPTPVTDALAWLRGGNWVARAGVVLLFVGLALLVGLAVEAGFFPIELRLMAAALAGGALVGAGWYWRARGGFGVTLQGGGVGVLYLVVYAALQLYGLLSPALAFGLMAVIAALAAGLAVVQDQPALAVLGSLGGFGAPIAASTGGGDPVLLFGYYALLNLGVAGVALWRTWRGLILVGFVCTFIIGAVWGGLAYEPALYGQIQPFLAFFFFLYLALAVLVARRADSAPPDAPGLLYGRVEGTLAFGLPVAVLALQIALTEHLPYGSAWSAGALAAVYLAASVGVRRWESRRFRPLSEAFLAAGLALATITVPLADTDVWAGSFWALEAAGLAWFGVRYGRRWMRTGALLLAVAAALALGWSVLGGDAWQMGGYGLSGWAVAVGLVTTAGVTRGVLLPEWERGLRALAFWLGVWWWIAASVVLVGDLSAYRTQPAMALLLFSASGLAAGALGRRLQWTRLASAAFTLAPLALLILLTQADRLDHPLDALGWMGWPVAIGTLAVLVGTVREVASREALFLGHLGGLALAVAVAAWDGTYWADRLLIGTGWAMAVPGLVSAAVLFVLLSPPAPLLRRYQSGGPAAASAYRAAGWLLGGTVVLWLLATTAGDDGSASPLPYLPVLNPLDLVQAAALLVGFRAVRRLRPPARQAAAWLLGTLGVVVLSGVVARSVHHLGGVAYAAETMWSSGVFQTALAIAWAGVAFALMVTASRRARRGLWFGGAALLGLVIAKLFTVDLEAASAVARVVSFIAVGLLALGIGYAAPLPPAREDAEVELPREQEEAGAL